MSTEFHYAAGVSIGKNTVINQHCYLDGRGGLSIGDNVNISAHVLLLTGSHDIQDGALFTGWVQPVVIEDYVWLCTRAMILPGVTVGRGAVVAAGAVVTKSVDPYAVVAGIPARKMGERNSELLYRFDYHPSWQ